MYRTNHGVAADYYAVGVIGYELMIGRVFQIIEIKYYFLYQRPYIGKNRKDIRNAIMGGQVQILNCDVPEGWSLTSADFINRVS